MSSDNFYVVRRDPDDRRWVLTMGFESDDLPDCKIPTHPHDPRFASETAALSEGFRRHSEYGVSTASWCVTIDGHAPGCEHVGRTDPPVETLGRDDLHQALLERCLSTRYQQGRTLDEQAYECPHYVPLQGPLGNDWGVIVNPASERFAQLVFEHDDCGCPQTGNGRRHL